MKTNKKVIAGIMTAVVAAGVGATVALAEPPPHPDHVAFAQRTSDLMVATLFAALTQEFDETTPANVEEGKRSISLIFNDRNTDMRLVGTAAPLRANDVPQDPFEAAALADALTGTAKTAVERVSGTWYYRRSVPLSNFREACYLCHSNFGATPDPREWVGALMLRVPIGR